MKFLIALLIFTVQAHATVPQSWFLPLAQPKPGGDPEFFRHRPDAAQVEHLKPLSAHDLSSVTAADLARLNQEQLDQIYFRLRSGPFPQGDYRGTVLVKNDLAVTVEEKLIEILIKPGTLGGFFKNALLKKLCSTEDSAKCVGEFLWAGKRFYTPRADGAVEVRNAIAPLRANAALTLLGFSNLLGPLHKEKQERFNGSSAYMLFPANVYCGISMVDTRRESVIVDFAYGDDFSGSGGRPFIPEIDGLAARSGASIRDELRMVKPGLYLGRAYVEKIFVLNFILESIQQPAGTGDNRCWTGDI